MSCKITAGDIFGLSTVTLENELIRALIIAGKGAELLELEWKPLGVNCLYRSDVPFEAYSGRNLAENRLKSHTEMSLGGWMTVLPHRAKYKGIELEQGNGGIAATVPWEYAIALKEEKAVSVRFFVNLPLIPMRAEKTFTLRDSSGELIIDESVTFNGDGPILFTWTEHAVFGGNFVDENTVISPPSGKAFDAWAHMEAPENELSYFEHSIEAFPFKSGPYTLSCPLPKNYGGMEFVVFRNLSDGRASLYNPKIGLSLTLAWDKHRFPYMRSLYRSDGACVVGLEPGDDMFSGFEHSLKHETYTKMHPGEKISTSFSLKYKPD